MTNYVYILSTRNLEAEVNFQTDKIFLGPIPSPSGISLDFTSDLQESCLSR